MDLEPFSKGAQAIKNCNGSRVQPSPLIDAMRDLDHISRQINNTLANYDRFKREELSAAQLSEARKSTQTATSVARLTKLAFISIPLNFVTSFFGVNMSQFGTGDPSLWTFFVTAILLICITLTPFLGRMLSPHVPVATLKLPNISFATGFWFFALSVCHCHAKDQLLSTSIMRYVLSKSRITLNRLPSIHEFLWWEKSLEWQHPSWYCGFWIRRITTIMKSVDSEADRKGWTVGLLERFSGRNSWWRAMFDDPSSD